MFKLWCERGIRITFLPLPLVPAPRLSRKWLPSSVNSSCHIIKLFELFVQKREKRAQCFKYWVSFDCFIGTFKSGQIFHFHIAKCKFALNQFLMMRVFKTENLSVCVVFCGFCSDHFSLPSFHISMLFDYRQFFAV